MLSIDWTRRGMAAVPVNHHLVCGVATAVSDRSLIGERRDIDRVVRRNQPPGQPTTAGTAPKWRYSSKRKSKPLLGVRLP